MAFAAIHIPDFMVQSVARVETAPRDRPVALIEGTPPHCKVVAANPTALRAGIQLGMAKSLAEQFLLVQIHRRSPSLEKSAHAALLDLGWSVSPRVEAAAPDTIVLDLSGLTALFGSDHAIAGEITAKASCLSLAANVAVAYNIEAAILAARGFSGITVIPEGQEASSLGPLPVQSLSLPEEILSTLAMWGIRSCAALAALPVPELSERLGQEGVRLHTLARGANTRAFILAEMKTTFEEEMAMEDSVEELEPLSFILGRLLDQLCARLDARALAVQSIRTRFDLDTGHESSSLHQEGNRRARSAPREKAAADAKLYEKVLALHVPMRDSKMLLKLLRLQLQSDPPQFPIQKVKLAAEPAAPRTTQKEFFLPSSPDPVKLELTIAGLANLVGGENIGSVKIVDTHRPGEFRMSHFAVIATVSHKKKKRERTLAPHFEPPSSQPETLNLHSKEDLEKDSRKTAIFRTFRPPLSARVTLREGRPMKILFQGLRGNVLQVSGPWRTSGDWWREDAWHHDEWDLEISFELPQATASLFNAQNGTTQSPKNRTQAVYRVHYDGIRGNWFVLGVYD